MSARKIFQQIDFLVITCLSAVFALAGCQQEDTAEKAEQKIDHAAENAEQKIEHTTETAIKKLRLQRSYWIRRPTVPKIY